MAALHIQNLKKAFGGLPAINDVSLKVEEGERRLIIGPNGAGKTTLFNLVTGDLGSDSGKIFLFDQEITKRSTHRRVHLGLARTYQIITLFPRDTLEHNIVLSLLGLSSQRWLSATQRICWRSSSPRERWAPWRRRILPKPAQSLPSI